MKKCVKFGSASRLKQTGIMLLKQTKEVDIDVYSIIFLFRLMSTTISRCFSCYLFLQILIFFFHIPVCVLAH